MSSFEQKSFEEQTALVKQVCDLLKKHELNDMKAEIYFEEVMNLSVGEMENKTLLKIGKTCDPSKKAQVDAFNAELKPLIEGIDGVLNQVKLVLGVGS